MLYTKQDYQNARSEVRKHKYGTPEYDAAFEVMGNIGRAIADQEIGTFEFTSIDSGVHRTKLLDGRII